MKWCKFDVRPHISLLASLLASKFLKESAIAFRKKDQEKVIQIR